MSELPAVNWCMWQKIVTTMMPTDEERAKLQEFQHATDDLVLGSAEQFLSMLCSIPDLSARLSLWAFKLDYETTESVSVV